VIVQPTITLQDILTDIDKLFSLGEIKTVGVRDSLKSKVNDAITSKNWKKVLTSAFVKELNFQLSKNRITQTAYDVLYKDYQWIINN